MKALRPAPLALVLVLAGCEENPLAETDEALVRGTVTIQGERLFGVQVFFFPSPADSGVTVTEHTDNDGEYEVFLEPGIYAPQVPTWDYTQPPHPECRPEPPEHEFEAGQIYQIDFNCVW